MRQYASTSRFINRCCQSAIACIMAWLLLPPATLSAESRENISGTIKEIRFAAPNNIYPNISRKDGRMALELLMQKAIVKNSYPYCVELIFIDPEPTLADAIHRGGYHFVTLSSIDYFKIRNAVHLDPILIPSKIGQPTETLLLLIRNDQTLSTIRQKEERLLIIEGGAIGDLSKIWIDTLLIGRGLPVSTQFFTKIRKVNKPGRAVLPVFFNQADACVVTQSALESIEELNPQIGRQLKPLHQSEGLVRFMICATKEPTHEDVDTLVRESIDMALNPETQQAMTILQMKRFIKINPDILEATQRLLLQHEKITVHRKK